MDGANRYEASRTIVRDAFLTRPGATGAASVYVATGANFPDALSASSAAGSKAIPVLLVDGYSSTVDADTKQLLQDLGVTKITIAGGPNSVSDTLMASLNEIAPTTRISGSDRYAASFNLAKDAFGTTHPTDVYIATGLNFPDALAGAVLAGKSNAPLIVVPGWCVPTYTKTFIQNSGISHATLLGGPDSLSGGVEFFSTC
jgi:putative cell wall-binding protein